MSEQARIQELETTLTRVLDFVSRNEHPTYRTTVGNTITERRNFQAETLLYTVRSIVEPALRPAANAALGSKS
jgi:hypothetical protein